MNALTPSFNLRHSAPKTIEYNVITSYPSADLTRHLLTCFVTASTEPFNHLTFARGPNTRNGVKGLGLTPTYRTVRGVHPHR